MADVGRSTSGHVQEVFCHSRVTERLLRNWGDWMAMLDDPRPASISVQPMFRDYVAGYRATKSRVYPECPDTALLTDGLLAQLPGRDINCLICHYVLGLSSRHAASLLSMADESDRSIKKNRSDRLRCTNRTYTTWLGNAFENALTIFELAETKFVEKRGFENVDD